MQFAEAKAKMSAIRADLQTAVDTIVANTRYTTAAQVQEVAKAVLDARAQAVTLRDEFVAGSEATRRSLFAKLFGLPVAADATTTLVYRDSVDRAECLGDDDFAPALTQALNQGDQLMARAIAARADTRGLTSIAATYAEAVGQSDTYAELIELPTGRNFSAATALIFNVPVPALPAEIASIIRAAAPGVLTGDDATGKLQKLADTTPAQLTKPKSKGYSPGSVGSVF